MTLNEAIKHAEEVADKKEREKQKWERWLKNDSDYRASVEKVSCELCAEEHRQLAEWLKELKQLREQTSWIPVSERLPDIHNCFQECLITNKHKSVYKAFFTDINGKQWWSVDDVIAWMPLPQPYKGESEDAE